MNLYRAHHVSRRERRLDSRSQRNADIAGRRAAKWLMVSDSSLAADIHDHRPGCGDGAAGGAWLALRRRPEAALRWEDAVGPRIRRGRHRLPRAHDVLRRRAKNRQKKFWKSLPDSLDLLTTCVEAGLSLDFAFQRVSERQKGPVGNEITRMLREKALGQTRKEALTGMAERIDLQDVTCSSTR